MVYLLNMVIFHGYVTNNQMLNDGQRAGWLGCGLCLESKLDFVTRFANPGPVHF